MTPFNTIVMEKNAISFTRKILYDVKSISQWVGTIDKRLRKMREPN